jgi:hypothetical protein
VVDDALLLGGEARERVSGILVLSLSQLKLVYKEQPTNPKEFQKNKQSRLSLFALNEICPPTLISLKVSAALST